jgi:hypothetical protein
LSEQHSDARLEKRRKRFISPSRVHHAILLLLPLARRRRRASRCGSDDDDDDDGRTRCLRWSSPQEEERWQLIIIIIIVIVIIVIIVGRGRWRSEQGMGQDRVGRRRNCRRDNSENDARPTRRRREPLPDPHLPSRSRRRRSAQRRGEQHARLSYRHSPWKIAVVPRAGGAAGVLPGRRPRRLPIGPKSGPRAVLVSTDDERDLTVHRGTTKVDATVRRLSQGIGGGVD